MSVCTSVCPHVTARLPLNGFPWNLVLETSMSIRVETLNFVEIGLKRWAVNVNTWITFIVDGDRYLRRTYWTHCFVSIATTVIRTRLNATLCVLCPSSLTRILAPLYIAVIRRYIRFMLHLRLKSIITLVCDCTTAVAKSFANAVTLLAFPVFFLSLVHLTEF
jgi:hypothetical protein